VGQHGRRDARSGIAEDQHGYDQYSTPDPEKTGKETNHAADQNKEKKIEKGHRGNFLNYGFIWKKKPIKSRKEIMLSTYFNHDLLRGKIQSGAVEMSLTPDGHDPVCPEINSAIFNSSKKCLDKAGELRVERRGKWSDH